MNNSNNSSAYEHVFCDIDNPPQGLGEKTYENALYTLRSLQTVNVQLSLTKRQFSIYEINKLPMTKLYLRSLGISAKELDKLSIIHVTGTKGKGSTCTYTENILRSKHYRTGLFTSPHIFEERERIRIDGEPLRKEMFREYFWHCFDTIKEDCSPLMPYVFQFITVMAFYVFLKENIDVVVLEVGIGGENDCTNIIRNPVVCGITHLGIDHIFSLGDTREKIAWHKAGIFKPGTTAITVSQQDVALKVLYERAKERKCSLYMAPPLENYSSLKDNLKDIFQEKENFELENMSIAVQLARVWTHNHNEDATKRKWVDVFDGEKVPEIDKYVPDINDSITILECVKLPGRINIIREGNITYYMDGAHTNGSMECCCTWFKKKSKEECLRNRDNNIRNALIFSVSGFRDPQAMMKCLKECQFDLVMFVSNRLNVDENVELTSQYNDLLETWMSLFKNDDNEVHQTNGKESSSSHTVKGFSCISNALEWCKLNMANCHNENSSQAPALHGVTHLQILITGSIYLVGNVLKSLKNIN